MIQLHWINGQAVPKITCASCGEVIINAKQAGIVFRNFMNNGEITNVLYVHKNFVKGDCMAKAESMIRSGGGEPGWHELSEHLAFLIDNVDLTAKDIERHPT